MSALDDPVAATARTSLGGALLRSSLARLAAIALLRIAALLFAVINIDECDLLLGARMIWKGAIPYVGVVENKPPLAMIAYLPAAGFGFALWPMRLVSIALVFLTCEVLGRAARRWTNSDAIGHFAAWIAVAATMCDVPLVGPELLMNLPSAIALYLFVRVAASGRIATTAGAGFFIGVATLFKQQAGILAVALGLALALHAVSRPSERRRAVAQIAALTVGALLPWIATFALFRAIGHDAELREWVIDRSFRYVSHGAGSKLGRLAEALAVCIVIGAPLPWLLAVRQTLRRRFADLVWLALAIAFALTWLAVSLGGRFYEHYFLQFAPLLALLAAPEAASLAERWPDFSTAKRRLIAFAAIAPVFIYLGYTVGRGLLGTYPAQEPKTIEVARWLREHSAPDERVFVWGHYTPIYVLGERLPGTRYYNTSVHWGNFDPSHLADGFDPAPYRSERDLAATISDLENNRVPIVVDTAPADIHHWSRIPIDRFPDLDGYLRAHYQLVARPAGAAVYRRR